MSRNEHDKFRDLFKGSKEQTTVAVAGKQPGRGRASSNSPHGAGSRESGASKSSKSIKRKSKGTPKKASGNNNNRKKQSTATGTPSPISRSPDASNRRASKSPHRVALQPSPRTPPAMIATTPPTAKARTPTRKISTTTAQWNGKDVQEKTQFCPTVFENDAGAAAGGGGGGATIEMAQARIKERRLQWKKEEQPKSGSTDNSADNNCYVGAREEIKEVVKTTRTIFENDDNHPAPAGEEKDKLQWRSSAAAKECMSEPEIRKKKTSDDVVRGAVSDRPPREPREAKLRHLLSTMPTRAPVRTPPTGGAASTMTVIAPSTRPVMLEPTSGTSHTYTGEGFGSGSVPSEKEERPASCYLAPNMQRAEFTAAAFTKKNEQRQVNSEPYEK